MSFLLILALLSSVDATSTIVSSTSGFRNTETSDKGLSTREVVVIPGTNNKIPFVSLPRLQTRRYRSRNSRITLRSSKDYHFLLNCRGGSDGDGESESEDDDDSGSDDETDDDDDESEESEDYTDDYDEEDEDEDEDEDEGKKDGADYAGDDAFRNSLMKKSALDKNDFVDPYFISPSLQIYTTFGTILLSRKVDMFSPKLVRLIRFLFIFQIIIQQAFIFYVRIMAKRGNDRTLVELKNPLTDMVESQLDDLGGGNGMVKSLASSFLKKESTVLEYDIGQASAMQGSILFNMLLMWFLHFKMQQIQPLLVSIVNGLLQLVYNPLFQVYVMGRNLERPFKSPDVFKPPNVATDGQSEEGTTDDVVTEEDVDVEHDYTTTTMVRDENIVMSNEEESVETEVDDDDVCQEDDNNDSDNEDDK